MRTISLFGEIWGIGPATALKLYEKGYRTLDDLKNESSLTHAQKIGLQYFDDIKQRIPRREVGDRWLFNHSNVPMEAERKIILFILAITALTRTLP